MKVARSVAEMLSEHTTLTLECIDRMYLNVYVPLLQAGAGVAYFSAIAMNDGSLDRRNGVDDPDAGRRA